MTESPDIDGDIPWIKIQEQADFAQISLGGEWILGFAEKLHQDLLPLTKIKAKNIAIDYSGISKIDTLGAWLLFRTTRDFERLNAKVIRKGLREDFESLYQTISKNDNPCLTETPRKSVLISELEDIGVATVRILTELGRFISFTGLVTQRLIGTIRHPSRLRGISLVYQMEQVGFKALFIIGLMSFLIGAVIVNQGAIQLRQFGAEVFVVDMLAVSLLRELGILMTAIMVAGRSGSAFTAQIGSMVLHEEVDAMKTLGLHPIDTLVIPRFLALVIVLPILAFYADIMGLFGGALMGWVTLDISPGAFIQRFQEAVLLSTFFVGIIKAPFFAAVIALSGCFEGLSVSGSAESVGERTTRSVVQSIFLVIVLDAVFAIFFTALDW